MTSESQHGSFALAIHGGAGTILRANLTDEKERDIRAVLDQSLRAGHDVLKSGGSSLDAVQAAVVVMEDSPLFNAGKGAVYTHEGGHEQDACLMDGATREVGAVTGVKHIRNPILLARLVFDKSSHVLLSGEGAERFAVANGIELEEDQSYFDTEFRYKQLQKALALEKQYKKQTTQLDHSDDRDKIGTVGAVALDSHGNLAAATSTGGMTNKRYGRVGDTPVIGAGTYADNQTCAVSATGVGEFIMRSVLAYDIAAMIEYKSMTLEEASQLAVMQKFKALGGSGGVIAIDRTGKIVMPFNSPGMYRGLIRADGVSEVKIFRD